MYVWWTSEITGNWNMKLTPFYGTEVKKLWNFTST